MEIAYEFFEAYAHDWSFTGNIEYYGKLFI